MATIKDFDLALSLTPALKASPEQVLAEQLAMVLETEPGQLPWDPKFGAALADFVGRTADSTQVSKARRRIQAAVERWLPDSTVSSVNAMLTDQYGVRRYRRAVPVAEGVMAAEATSAQLMIQIVVETPEGPLDLEVNLSQ